MNYLSYQEASDLCKKNKVSSFNDFHKRYKDISNELPSKPALIYKTSGWVNWASFLQKFFLTYQEASALCIKHNVVSGENYVNRYKDIHPQLPGAPRQKYKTSGWKGMGEFLGNGRIGHRKAFLSYQEASAICIKHNLLNRTAYDEQYKNISNHLPSNPNKIYKSSGWNGWSEFLGITKAFLSYQEASAICIKHNVTGQIDYKKRYKEIHFQLPSHPSEAYKDSGWSNLREFLNKTA